MSYLIDPNGRWWRWPSAVLAEQLGYPDADFDLAGYAARNLGYVWLIVAPEMTMLQFRAGMISAAAITSLQAYLRKSLQDQKPVGLVYFASGWLEEGHTELDPLMQRLYELSVFDEPHVRDLFIRHMHEPRRWLTENKHDLTGLFSLWRSVGEIYCDPISSYLKRTGLIDRTVLLRPVPGEGLCVMSTGNGFTAYDGFSFRSFVGRKLTDQPDRAYGAWVSQAYESCLNSGDPVIDDVDAIVEEPGYDARRRRYQRVILRWRDGDGNYLITGSSVLNPNIAIPLAVESTSREH